MFFKWDSEVNLVNVPLCCGQDLHCEVNWDYVYCRRVEVNTAAALFTILEQIQINKTWRWHDLTIKTWT